MKGPDFRNELSWKFHEDFACFGGSGTGAVGHDSSLGYGETMMNGGMWGFGNWMGGDGGIWVPILVVILVVGFVAWLVKGRGK